MRNYRSGSVIALALGAALALTGCAPDAVPVPSEPSQPPRSSAPGAETEAPEAGRAGGDATPRDADLTAVVFGATWQEAVSAASERFDGEPVSVSFEWEANVYAYTVKLLTSTEVYLARFNADTGEMLGEWTKSRGGNGRAWTPNGVFDGAQVIEPNEAVAAALAAVPGVFEEWELESDDGALVYEVQIDRGNDDVDVKLDAGSGKVIKIDD